MPRRHDPGQHAAPVVAHQVEGLHLHGVGERQDVAHEVLGGVVADLGRAGAAAVAALVGRDGAVPGTAERPQLVAPGPRGLGEAVEEQDPPALVRAAGPAGEGEAAGLDLEPVDGPDGVHDGRARAPRRRSHRLRARASSGLSRRISSGTESTSAPLGHVVVGDRRERGTPALACSSGGTSSRKPHRFRANRTS